MKTKLKQLINYLNKCSPNYITQSNLEQLNTINEINHIMSGSVDIPTILLWTFSKSIPVTIVVNSEFDRKLLIQTISRFDKLQAFNEVEILNSVDVKTVEYNKLYFYLNMYDLNKILPNPILDSSVVKYYEWLNQEISPKVYKSLLENHFVTIDTASNVNLSEDGLSHIEDLLNIKFETYPHIYTYLIAFLVSRYLLNVNIDYEIVNNQIILAGNYSHLHKTYSSLSRLVTSFLYVKHNISQVPNSNLYYDNQLPNIVSKNIYGVYAQYGYPTDEVKFVHNYIEKLPLAIHKGKSNKDSKIVLVSDAQTFELAKNVQLQLNQLNRICTVVSPLLTIRDKDWYVIDLTNYPILLQSDIKIVDSNTLSQDKLSQKDLARLYSGMVAKYNKCYKLNSDLSYINANILNQYQSEWVRKFSNTQNHRYYEMENEFLLQSSNRFRKYKHLSDYSNSMYQLMEELFTKYQTGLFTG